MRTGSVMTKSQKDAKHVGQEPMQNAMCARLCPGLCMLDAGYWEFPLKAQECHLSLLRPPPGTGSNFLADFLCASWQVGAKEQQ